MLISDSDISPPPATQTTPRIATPTTARIVTPKTPSIGRTSDLAATTTPTDRSKYSCNDIITAKCFC